MADTCFVIMPYGHKKDVDGRDVDFDHVYETMIAKAVEKVADLACLRCDDIEKPGWIHERMLRHILEDRVAIVDTSTLNANVFYELGVRHALRRSTTILVHRKGTTWPFNIAGMSSIEYATTPRGLEIGAAKIQRFIVNALGDVAGTDSLVFSAIPDLEVRRTPKRITRSTTVYFSLAKVSGKRIGLVTGDREDIHVGDVWATSENTNMQMDTFYGKSTSATVRYLGAKKSETGKLLEDTIGIELAQKMGSDLEVPPATVIVTRSGELSRNKVKWIFHVASVVGEPREGYRPVSRLDQCVKNALRRASELRDENPTTILLPIFGTGPAGGNFAKHASTCFEAAIDHLETADTPIRDVLFYVLTDVDLETCKTLLRSHSSIGASGPCSPSG